MAKSGNSLQKSNIMLALSSKLLFLVIIDSYRVRIKRILSKGWRKMDQKPFGAEGDLHLVQ
jgi:hypothetical protein